MDKKARKKAIKAEIKAREKADSKKGFKLLGCWLVSILMFGAFATYQAKAADIEITYYAKSEHFSPLPFNQEHNFLGVEIRNDQRGVGVAAFKNSYRHHSKMINYSEYWQQGNLEYSISAALVTGYEHKKVRNECPLSRGAKYCPIVSAGVAYTKYRYIKPKLSIFGRSLVLSLSARF